MHKQLPGLMDQLGLVNNRRDRVAKFLAASPSSLSLLEADALLSGAQTHFRSEIAFFQAIDQRLETAGTLEDETAKSSEIDTINKEAAAHEGVTAGTAAFCMQAVAAASVFTFKGVGLQGQLEFVKEMLAEVATLQAGAPKADSGSPFPVVMSATVVSLSLNTAHELLSKAEALLSSTLESGSVDEAKTAEIVDYCKEAVSAASVLMLKGMEKNRGYRA